MKIIAIIFIAAQAALAGMASCTTDTDCEVELPLRLMAWTAEREAAGDCNVLDEWKACAKDGSIIYAYQGAPMFAIEDSTLTWTADLKSVATRPYKGGERIYWGDVDDDRDDGFTVLTDETGKVRDIAVW